MGAVIPIRPGGRLPPPKSTNPRGELFIATSEEDGGCWAVVLDAGGVEAVLTTRFAYSDAVLAACRIAAETGTDFDDGGGQAA